MTLYEIDSKIEDLLERMVDPETGEVDEATAEEFEALQMERGAKIENVALWYKNTLADANAIEAEIRNLQDRKKKLDTRTEWLKGYLTNALNGERFETPKVAISYRKSETVEFENAEAFCSANADNEMVVTTTITRKPNKAKLKAYMKEGFFFKGVWLEEHQNIQIK